MKKKFQFTLFILLTFNGGFCQEYTDKLYGVLSKYSFSRNEYNSSEIGILLGNAEMGGLADKLGLGFEELWLAELWENEWQRKPMHGPLLKLENFGDSIVNYSQTLDISNGILSTKVIFDKTNKGYQSTIFFSESDKNKLCLRIKNLSKNNDLTFKLNVPLNEYAIKRNGNNNISTETDRNSFTKVKWFLNSSQTLNGKNETRTVQVNPGQEIDLIFSVYTNWNKSAYDLAEAYVDNIHFDQLLNKNKLIWDSYWKQAAALFIPNKQLEELYYRSVYWILSTGASENFLPGENQFAENSWGMIPFSYGYAGWLLHAFPALGFPEKAKIVAKNHYKIQALKDNAKIFIPDEIRINDEPICFAHQITTTGHLDSAGLRGTRIHKMHQFSRPNHTQHNLIGLVTSGFHMISRYYPDNDFLKNYTLPIMNGTAEFWRNLVFWDESRPQDQSYLLPPFQSVSENLAETSVLDGVLAAKWNLNMAYEYGKKYGEFPYVRDKWRIISERLYMPQNEKYYLEYLGDNLKREGGGYLGIRAHLWLGYPAIEIRDQMDSVKVNNSLDQVWERNKSGDGMITFIANWFALTDLYNNRPDKALEKALHNLKCLDESKVALCETPKGGRPYFLTGVASYVLVPISMILQSYQDQIKVFPALPSSWKDVSFYNFPAESGIRVSGEMENGKVKWVQYLKDGNEILKTKDSRTINISKEIN